MTMLAGMRGCLPALLLLAGGAVAAEPSGAAPALAPFEARYEVDWGGIGVGQMEVKLAPDAAAGDACWTYRATSHPSLLARSLYGAPNEESDFCVVEGRVRPRHFQSLLPGDETQSYSLDFDWDKPGATDENGRMRTIPVGTVDSFALQQAVRLWVLAHAADTNPPIAEFDMVDRKNLTHYQFKLAGRERLRVHAGTFDTVILERVDNPKKEGHFWLAPERGYMPVKIQTRSGNKPAVTFTLANLAESK